MIKILQTFPGVSGKIKKKFNAFANSLTSWLPSAQIENEKLFSVIRRAWEKGNLFLLSSEEFIQFILYFKEE